MPKPKKFMPLSVLAADLLHNINDVPEEGRKYVSALSGELRLLEFDLDKEVDTLERALTHYAALAVSVFKINMYYHLIREFLSDELNKKLQDTINKLLGRLGNINSLIRKMVRAHV